MVQPKLNTPLKPATPDVPIKENSLKEIKEKGYFKTVCKYLHLCLIVIKLMELCSMIMRDINDDSTEGIMSQVCAYFGLWDLIGINPENWLEALEPADVLWLAVLVLQIDAFFHVFIFRGLAALRSDVKYGPTEWLIRHMQFCIPQIVLGGVVLLQLSKLNYEAVFRQINNIFYANTCYNLAVLIGSYVRLLKMPQQIPAPKEDFAG